MKYSEIDEIKKRLDNKDEVSLLMLQDLQIYLKKRIEAWGKEGGTYRIM